MSDELAGRRALEFFGLLAITSPAEKKQKDRSFAVAPQTKKVIPMDRLPKTK
jgi:hypothetical protein